MGGERRMKRKLWAWNWSGRKLKRLYAAVWLAGEGFSGATMMDHCIARGQGKFTDELGQTQDGRLQTFPVYSFISHWQQREGYSEMLHVLLKYLLSENLYQWLCKFSFYWEVCWSFIGVWCVFFTLSILHLCAQPVWCERNRQAQLNKQAHYCDWQMNVHCCLGWKKNMA